MKMMLMNGVMQKKEDDKMHEITTMNQEDKIENSKSNSEKPKSNLKKYGDYHDTTVLHLKKHMKISCLNPRKRRNVKNLTTISKACVCNGSALRS